MLNMTKHRGRYGELLPSSSVRHEGGETQPPDVASNLKRIRRQQGHSLETLARLSGVSRAMLGQIETGKSVPTITLIWKVAKALGVPATTLITSPVEARAALLPKAQVRTITSNGGRFSLRAFSRSDFALPYDFSELRLAAGHREGVPAFAIGTRATLTVLSGVVEIALGDDEPHRLKEGDGILFQGDIAHALFNPSTIEAIAYLVVAPARNSAQ